MIHIENGKYKLEDESVASIAAELTIALEIIRRGRHDQG